MLTFMLHLQPEKYSFPLLKHCHFETMQNYKRHKTKYINGIQLMDHGITEIER